MQQQLMVVLMVRTTYGSTNEAFRVDTDVSDILVHTSNTGYLGYCNQDSSQKKSFVPWDQWTKLSQDQKDRLIAERQKEQMSNKDDKAKIYH
jgi:hypothetical protein